MRAGGVGNSLARAAFKEMVLQLLSEADVNADLPSSADLGEAFNMPTRTRVAPLTCPTSSSNLDSSKLARFTGLGKKSFYGTGEFEEARVSNEIVQQ